MQFLNCRINLLTSPSARDPSCHAAANTRTHDKSTALLRVKQRIEAALSAHAGRFVVAPVPNITHVFYGRDVGYVVERIVLDDNIEAISATQMRRLGTER